MGSAGAGLCSDEGSSFSVSVAVDVDVEEVVGLKEADGGECWMMVLVTMNLYCGEEPSGVEVSRIRAWRMAFCGPCDISTA